VSEPAIEDLEGVRWLTLRRPETLHALTREDLRQLTAAVRSLPDGTEAIVFRAEGERAFSAGVHVDIFRDLDVAGARAFITELGGLLGAVRRAPVPTLCVIRGYCLGGAMELAMACDLRLADRTATFGMPEIAVGIPSVLDAATLQQYVGLSLAKEMLLTGDRYPVEAFAASGFLNVVVDPAELEDAVASMLARVQPHAGPATAAQKRLFGTWQNVGLDQAVEVSIGEFAETFGHAATVERIARYRR
jgi:enoyl-CoA hydratase